MMKKNVLTCAVVSLLVLAGVSQAALEPLITNVAGSSGNYGSGLAKTVHGGILTNGSLNLTNRSHVYVEVPAFLKDTADYVMTSNDDRTNASYTMTFTLTQAADVYLFIDLRVGHGSSFGSDPTTSGYPTNPDLGNVDGTNKMAWVLNAGFKDTGINIAVDENPGNAGNEGDIYINSYARLFKKHFDAGTVTLYEQNDTTNRNMYGVAAVVPEPATLVLMGLGGLSLLKRRRA
jgi:hypothetical protein